MKIHHLPFKGYSMWPTLREGDTLMVNTDLQSPTTKTESGDILLLRAHSEWFAHRIIRSSSEMVTKGDFSNQSDDSGVPFGVVVGFTRNGKTVYWGQRGQFLKKWIAAASRLCLKFNSSSMPQTLFRRGIKAFILVLSSFHRVSLRVPLLFRNQLRIITNPRT